MKYEPIIKSVLDTDLYKINMAAVVFHNFPKAWVKYRFILRSKVQFPEGFDKELLAQISYTSNLKLTDAEYLWMTGISYHRRTFLEWFKNFEPNPLEVGVWQEKNGDITIEIEGYWYRTILWEVKLMAIISELYFKMTNQLPNDDWRLKIGTKATNLYNAGCKWIDFGTRRRYSYSTQDEVVNTMRHYSGFLGTSNPHFAMKYGVSPHGTYAHESVMGMSALYGPRLANKMWMKLWSEYYEGNVGVALTDTFTTDVFLNDFGSYEARLFDGVRQDSGDPFIWGKVMCKHYDKLNISTKTKKFVFSDNLNDEKYIRIHNAFKNDCLPVGGIGTFLTNDVFSEEQKFKGCRPLNMVIKLTSINFGRGTIDVVKLSDDPGKHTGNPDAVRKIKEELGI